MRISISIPLSSRTLSQCFVSPGLSRSRPQAAHNGLPLAVVGSTAPLPHATHFIARLHHWLPGFAAERLGKFWNVYHNTVDAVFTRRMRIGYRICAQILSPLILAGPLCKADKESLVGRESVGIGEFLTLRGLLPGGVGKNRSP